MNGNNFFPKKSFEIGYAVFRVAEAVRQSRSGFAHHLEAQALELLLAGSRDDFSSARGTLYSLEHLLRFGADLNILAQRNVELVLNEMNLLNSAIAEYNKPAILPDTDLFPNYNYENVAQKEANDLVPSLPKEEKPINFIYQDSLRGTASDNAGISQLAPTGLPNGQRGLRVADKTNQNMASLAEYTNESKSNGRQSNVLERIRQSGNLSEGKEGCRLRDVQEFLPNVSERTLRYDLQKLGEQGLIERIGNGGPSTYYRIKEQPLMEA